MRKRYLVLPVIVAAAGGTIALLQTEHSPQAEGIIAETRITRPSRSSSFTLDSSDERIKLDPRESIRLNLKLHPGKGKVRFVAPNGGSINRGGGHSEVDPPGSGQSIDLGFEVGESPGRYTLEVSQGQATKIVEFWVGPEPPRGAAGPPLTFTGSENGGRP
ncbi:MAG: hypothetical protein QOD80_167 [Verrucomicrobiota bacterium]|jgi:hypothetical protein